MGNGRFGGRSPGDDDDSWAVESSGGGVALLHRGVRKRVIGSSLVAGDWVELLLDSPAGTLSVAVRGSDPLPAFQAVGGGRLVPVVAVGSETLVGLTILASGPW